jgi:Ran GTPase-activating protein (RanGAP) involved in mRNA processing and transport
MTALERLYLSKNEIGDKGCEALAPALAQMTALKQLILEENEIGDKGKMMIREAWKNAGKDSGLHF